MEQMGWTILICLIVVSIVAGVGINYAITYSNYQSIPYYDKWCGLNMTQTWENAGKLWYIDMEPCTSINIHTNSTK